MTNVSDENESQQVENHIEYLKYATSKFIESLVKDMYDSVGEPEMLRDTFPPEVAASQIRAEVIWVLSDQAHQSFLGLKRKLKKPKRKLKKPKQK